MPKLSVITINYNNRNGLERTVRSVLAQGPGMEFIVIDGGSTDGSREFLEQQQEHIDHWLSEPDKGIYDAQNKGAALATGEYLLFMNAGDTFYSSQVLKELSDAMDSSSAVIYGNSEIIDKGSRTILVPPSALTLDFWYRSTLNHQAVLMRKDVFGKYGPFRLSYRICADFDLLLRAFKAIPSGFLHLPVTVCSYDQSGFSALPENFEEMIREKEEILKEQLTQGEYRKARKQYLDGLSWKERIRQRMYSNSLTKKIFLLLHGIFFKQKTSNG
jgi:glycosyltransferase involved in cell wall biosynthesis